MLSIPSCKTADPNYRYKMPKLQAKVEGRGNGIKTNIVNMGEIAKALKRPPDYPTRFCGHELGSQAKFEGAEGKAIVNGAHEQRDLQILLDKFIEKFVLCGNCELPEIDLAVKKGRVVYSCNACGNQSEVDNAHKLATFILKNPPDGTDSTMGAKKKKTSEPDKLIDQEPETIPIHSKKLMKVLETEEQLEIAQQDDISYTSHDMIDSISQSLLSRLTEEGSLKVDPNGFARVLQETQISQALSNKMKVYLALIVLFHKSVGIVSRETIKTQFSFIEAVVAGANYKDIMPPIEYFFAQGASRFLENEFELGKIFPYVLQEIYSLSIVEQKSILKYYDRKHKSKNVDEFEAFNKCKSAATPFLKFLAESANDSSDDSN